MISTSIFDLAHILLIPINNTTQSPSVFPPQYFCQLIVNKVLHLFHLLWVIQQFCTLRFWEEVVQR